MEIENQTSWRWEGYVDWRGRAAVRTKHGGTRAAFFVLVVEVLENLAYLANASNLVLYLTQYMHFSPSESANSVANFMGTAFLLALLGGLLYDAFLTAYVIYIISAVTEFLVLIGSLLNSWAPRSTSNVVASMGSSPQLSKEEELGATEKETNNPQSPSHTLKFLNREGKLSCSVHQVEEVKIVLNVLPIFACTIVLNCCLAQLSTFSVQQAATMNTKLGSLKLPPPPSQSSPSSSS